MVGIDERQRDLPVQCRVEGLPELETGRAAVEHQQPVAAVGDAGAGDQGAAGRAGLMATTWGGGVGGPPGQIGLEVAGAAGKVVAQPRSSPLA